MAVTRAELIRRYEQLADALVPGTLAPVAELYQRFVRELAELDNEPVDTAFVNTEIAAGMIGVTAKTIAHWCAAGRFPGARKTGGRGGKWVVPVAAIREYLGENATAETSR